MERSKVTAYEVAKRAGVSQPTVSRVFTPGQRVSADKKDRVRRAARDLGYLPNTLARSLNTGRSFTVGIVLAYLKNPFYTDALQKLSEALSAEGYHVIVFFAANMADEVDGVVDDLLAHQVDGMILASVSVSNDLTTRLQDLGMPYVLFNRGQEDRSLPAVTAANYTGGRKVADFLVKGGHTRIAHIAGWRKSLTGMDRCAGFVEGLAEHEMEPLSVIDSHYRRNVAREAVLTLFDAPVVPDAIFVGNDHMAFSVLETLREELGLTVPDDVSVVGYDDVPMASWRTFSLTTMRQPANRMVAETVRLLIGTIERSEAHSGHIEIDSQLIVRGSARVPDNWPSQANDTTSSTE